MPNSYVLWFYWKRILISPGNIIFLRTAHLGFEENEKLEGKISMRFFLSLLPSFTTLHLFFLFFLFCFVFNWNIIALQRCVNFCCTTAWINYKYTYTRSLVSLPPMHPASQSSLCSALFDPGDRSTPGLPIHHWLPEFTQTHPSRSSQNTNLRFLVFFKETI